MEKNSYVLWFYGEPIPVIKITGDENPIFMFYYSLSKFEELGVSEEKLKSAIEEFIRNKDEREVLSEDIENYEIINLDG